MSDHNYLVIIIHYGTYHIIKKIEELLRSREQLLSPPQIAVSRDQACRKRQDRNQ